MLVIALLVGLSGLFISVSSIPAPTQPFPRHELNTTAEANKDKHFCCWETGWGWGYAYYQNAVDMRNKLRSKTSIDTTHIGANECFQIGCISDNLPDEVVLCNDNPYPIEPNTNYLSAYVTDIIDECTFYQVPLFNSLTCGQKFDMDEYNVIIKRTNDHCYAK